jgi:catechol 2,3-dioxygenase-like lactoylglutathione lyase family enzyme
MSDDVSGGASERGFRATMLYHPSHQVQDLAEAEDFFERVFGRKSTAMATIMRDAPPSDYPRDYCTFTPINDLLFDTIDPKKYVVRGVQRYKTVTEPHLKAMGWYLEGMPALYRELRDHGIRVIGQLDEPADGDDPPTAPNSSMPIFFTLPEDAGLRYEFMPPIPFPADPRIQPGWSLPPVTPEDPLGIVCCSHHTILTDQPERELRMWVDVIGAPVIHEGRDDVRGTVATSIHYAGTTLQFATPDPGTSAHADWSANNTTTILTSGSDVAASPSDTYHAITWKVADVDRTERHLRSQGVQIQLRSDNTLVTDPATSLGIPWGFTTDLIPGDPRN